MVSTSSPLAVAAGLWALEEGGTAVDAAIAADAVLGVTQPLWTGLGGDAFALVDDGEQVSALNGSGASPAQLTLERCTEAAATAAPIDVAPGYEEMFTDFPTTLPDTSPLSVTVPGVVDAWAQLSERYGTLPFGRLFEPAIALAAGGFPVGRLTARAWRASAGRMAPGGPLPAEVRAGQRVVNPELAASLRALAAGGRPAHYEGPWAEEVASVVQAGGGLMTTADLAAHAGEWVTPVSTSYRGFEVYEAPPNGQGAAVLAALNLLDAGPVSPDRPEGLATTMAAVRDGMRLAHAHVADPRHAEVSEFWLRETDTVYTAAVAGGLAVSLISSVFYAFGSGLVAGGAPLQNRGLGFSLDPDHPGVAAPGKRPFHTIIPGLVRYPDRSPRPFAVLGVVGGPMQPQGQVQVLTRLIDAGADAQGALDAPRARWLGGDLVMLEPGLDGPFADALTDVGFAVSEHPLTGEAAGAGQVVLGHRDGWLEGAADPRRDGVAFGR